MDEIKIKATETANIEATETANIEATETANIEAEPKANREAKPKANSEATTTANIEATEKAIIEESNIFLKKANEEFIEFLKQNHQPHFKAKRYYSKRSICNCLFCGACKKRFLKCRKDIYYKEIEEGRNLTDSEIREIYDKNEYKGITANHYNIDGANSGNNPTK
jgi:hypothetical protein